MPADPALAAAHADARESLEAVHIVRVALARRSAQRSCRDPFTAADDLAVTNIIKQVRRIRIRTFKRSAKARLPHKPAIERRSARGVDRLSEILEHGQRRTLALQLGHVGAADAGAVT